MQTDLPDAFVVPVYEDGKLVGVQYQQNGPVEPILPDRGPPPASVRNSHLRTMRKKCKRASSSVSDTSLWNFVMNAIL